MPKPNWRITAGLVIVIAIAIWWMAFGIAEFLFDTSTIAGLIEGGLVGGVLLLTGLVAYRWRYIGGWLLVLEGVLPIFLAVSSGNLNFIVLLLLAGPPILAGILFLLD
jgi:hypothetical protein